MTFKAVTGIFIIDPIKTENAWGESPQTQIRIGKVIDRGTNLLTDQNAILAMDSYAKVGDTVAFLAYDGGYDKIMVKNKEVYLVKAQDLRAVIHD